MESENTLFLKIYKQSLLSSQALIELRKCPAPFGLGLDGLTEQSAKL